MSIFGNPLPYEDNTAASIIRRSGFPPEETYNQKPEIYQCPCCSEFAQAQERDRLVRAAKDQKDAEHRRLMQLDVFDERAKPLPSASQKRRQSYRAIGAPVDEPELEPQSEVPAPPATLDELRRARQAQADANQNPTAKLIVTVHHGSNLSGAPRDPLSVIVRCGAFEGRTAKVPRGKDALTTWDELFEFPYPNAEEPLEVLVINDSLPDSNEHLLGGVVVPSDALHSRECGNEELLPVMPEDQMQDSYGTVKEGPLGTIVASWYVSEDGQDRGLDASALEQQSLDQAQICTFVAHRVFQFTDNGSEPFPGGVLCVLRDTDDNCSESVLYTAGSLREPSVSPYFGKEGYHYMPENPSQLMELSTNKKLGHILVCVPKSETAAADEEEELIVVGAVPLDFERLHNKGSAVLLVESKSKEDALWGEIQIEWQNKPAVENDEAPRQIAPAVQEESLFVTAVRGLNLTNRKGTPIESGHVVITTEELEGAGTEAPAEVDEDGNHVINWNQEIRFIGVKPTEESIEVSAISDGRPVSTGRCAIPGDEGEVVVAMHDVTGGHRHLGDIVVDYKRLHVEESEGARAIEAPASEHEDSELADEEAELEDGEPMYPREDDDQPADAEDAQKQRDAPAEEAEEEEKPQLYTDADDAAAAEDEDENPFEEEEEEEAPVAQSRAAPVPEEEPAKPADDEDEDDEDPLEEEEEPEHAEDKPADDEDEDPLEEEEEPEQAEDKPADEHQDDAEDEDEDPLEEEEEPEQAEDKPTEEHHDDAQDEDEDPLEEEEEPEQAEDKPDEDHHDNDDEDMYPTEEPNAADEEVEEEVAPQQSREAPVMEDEDEDPLEEEEEPEHKDSEKEEDGMYPTEDAPADAADDGDKAHSDAADEENANSDDGMYPTEDAPNEAQDRAAPEAQDADDDGKDDGEDEDEGMYPTEDGPNETQDRAAPEAQDAEDEPEEHDMYPTEEPANDDGAESDADKYEHDEDAAAAGDDNGDDEKLYPTEDAPAAAAADAAGDAAESDAGTDMAAPKSNSRSPRAHPSWKRKPSGDGNNYPGYQKPWYPSGNPNADTHLPYEKTKLATKSQESIKELEARRARLAEESQRRGSSPRLSDDEL